MEAGRPRQQPRDRSADREEQRHPSYGEAPTGFERGDEQCFRCKCNGHTVDMCKAILDCIICNKKNAHLSTKCPVLKLPKPGASMFGLGKSGLGFFRIPDLDLKLETWSDPNPTGLVKVIGGTLTAETVQAQLAKLNRSDWNWEATPHGQDAFLVAFPSVEELQRMVDVDYHLKNHGVTLTISAWQDDGDVLPAYQLDEAWVHVTGVPHTWRHYLVFWALGSVIGTTFEVDMLTYRRKGVIRILVGMMNRELLPLTTDVVFGKEGYNVTFSIEGSDFVPAFPPPAHDDPNKDWDGDGTEKDRDMGGPDTEPATKKQKNSVVSNPSTSRQKEDEPVPMQTAAMMPSGSNHSQFLSPQVTCSSPILVTPLSPEAETRQFMMAQQKLAVLTHSGGGAMSLMPNQLKDSLPPNTCTRSAELQLQPSPDVELHQPIVVDEDLQTSEQHFIEPDSPKLLQTESSTCRPHVLPTEMNNAAPTTPSILSVADEDSLQKAMDNPRGTPRSPSTSQIKHTGIIDFRGRRKGKTFISAEKPDYTLCEKKSESEVGEDDDGSVLFAEDMDIRDSDLDIRDSESDSFYSEALYSTEDEMEDHTLLDLYEMENDMEDDSSEEESDDCFCENFIVAEGSKQKQMGKYDVCLLCKQPRWMGEEDDGRIIEEERELIMKPSEEKVDILGDEDVVQVERGIVRNWACANFSCLSQEESHRFVTRIVDMCVAIGMEFTLSPIKEDQAAPTDVERTLVDLHGKIIDHLTKCGRKEEQLGLLLVILPHNSRSYDKVEGVCKKLGITFYLSYAIEAMCTSKRDLRRIAREIQSKVVRCDARLRRLALPLVSEAPTLFFGADVFSCVPGDAGSDYISSVATSLDWPKFRRYFVRISHVEGTINVSSKLGSTITKFIYFFSKITKRTVEKIILFRNGLKDGQFGDFCHQEMSAIKTACAYFMDGYEPHITYVAVLPHAEMETTNKSGTGADLTGYKFWCRHSGGKKFSALACYHVVHDENNFVPGELQSLTSKLCSLHDRWIHPEIDIVPPAFYARLDGMEALEEWGRTKQLTKFQSE